MASDRNYYHPTNCSLLANQNGVTRFRDHPTLHWRDKLDSNDTNHYIYENSKSRVHNFAALLENYNPERSPEDANPLTPGFVQQAGRLDFDVGPNSHNGSSKISALSYRVPRFSYLSNNIAMKKYA